MELIERVQAYLHTKAVADHECILVPPFAVYVHATDNSSDANFALATTPLSKVSRVEINALCAVFAAHKRAACITFLDRLAWTLEAALKDAGFHEMSQQPVLVCTPATPVLPPLPPDISIVTLSADSSLDDVREGLDVNELGFNPDAAHATNEDAARFRQTLHNCRAFTLRYNGQGVSGGMFLPVHDGVTEVAGIATLVPWRRRGFAGIITAYITHAAFAYGADVVFLAGASDHAARVYRRVGFQPCGTLRAYGAPPAA